MTLDPPTIEAIARRVAELIGNGGEGVLSQDQAAKWLNVSARETHSPHETQPPNKMGALSRALPALRRDERGGRSHPQPGMKRRLIGRLARLCRKGAR